VGTVLAGLQSLLGGREEIG
jgi:hypothetical protein